MRHSCLRSDECSAGSPTLSNAHSSSSLGSRQGNSINRSDFQFCKPFNQAVPYVRVTHAFPQIRHLARVDFKVKKLIRTFAEINRQAPTVLDDRMNVRPGSERFLRALGVVLDKCRIAPAAAGDLSTKRSNSAFRLLVACCLAIRGSAKSGQRVRG